MPQTTSNPGSQPASERLTEVTKRNVAVVGEPASGTRQVALKTLAAAADEGRDALLVSTTRGADRLPVPSSVDMIDCTPGPTPTGAISVTSPHDLTGMGMRISQALNGAAQPVVALDSLASLLAWHDEPTVFRFLTILSGNLTRSDGLGLVLVKEGAHDTETAHTFASLFDGQMYVREGSEGVEARAEGIRSLPRDWILACH